MKDITSFLNNTFAVYRNMRTADGQGGYSMALIHVADIRGRLRPVNAPERLDADQRSVRMTHVLYCKADADIARGDTAVGAGADLRVIAVREPSYANHHLAVDCEEIVKEPAEVSS